MSGADKKATGSASALAAASASTLGVETVGEEKIQPSDEVLLEKIRLRFQQYNSSIVEQQKKIAKVRAEQQAEITRLNAELAKARDEIDRKRSEVDELVKQHTGVLTAKDKHIASAEKRCEEARTALAETNTTLQSLKVEFQQLSEKLATTKADSDTLIAKAKQAFPLSGWQSIGRLHSFIFEEMARKYPFTHYQWGAIYNTETIRPVAINNWNRGVRVHFNGTYLQGDNGASLYMGSAMMTRDTDDAGTQATKKADGTAEFLHHYVSSTGKKIGGSNSCDFGMYVRKLAHPWKKVGCFVSMTDTPLSPVLPLPVRM